MYQIAVAALILLFIASIDLTAFGFSYGVIGKRIRNTHLIAISTIGTISITTSLLIAFFVGGRIPTYIAEIVSSSLFIAVGIVKFILWRVDKGNELKEFTSFREALLLAVMLSVDGAGVAFGIGLGVSLWFILAISLISLFTHFLLFKTGFLFGRILQKRIKADLGWVGGVILITLGIIGFIT